MACAATRKIATPARPVIAQLVCRITSPFPRELCRTHGPAFCGLVRAFPVAARGPGAEPLRSDRAKAVAEFVSDLVSVRRPWLVLRFSSFPDLSSAFPDLSSAVPDLSFAGRSSEDRLSADLF